MQEMTLADARHNINSLVLMLGVPLSIETENLMRESWRLIQKELNEASILRGIREAELGLTVDGAEMFKRLKLRSCGGPEVELKRLKKVLDKDDQLS